MRSSSSAMKSSHHSLQLEEAHMQQGRPITAINKVNELFFKKKERNQLLSHTWGQEWMQVLSKAGRSVARLPGPLFSAFLCVPRPHLPGAQLPSHFPSKRQNLFLNTRNTGDQKEKWNHYCSKAVSLSLISLIRCLCEPNNFKTRVSSKTPSAGLGYHGQVWDCVVSGSFSWIFVSLYF